MPVIKSAIKQLRKNVKARASNTEKRDDMKDTMKQVEKLLKEKKFDEAMKKLQESYSKIDRMVKRNLLHKNAAGRRKSKLMRSMNAAKKA